MKIIYLSQNMGSYNSAFYQRDVMDEFARQHQVYFYGPAFPAYNVNDQMDDIIAKSPFKLPDIVVIGHAWLKDSPSINVDPHPSLNLFKLNLPKILILNKEYTNLEGKLNYVKLKGIDLVFTHHHRVEFYKKKTGITFIQWPFAVNHHHFVNSESEKKYDLFFTGILKNPNFPDKQNNLRIKVQRKLFHTIDEIKLFKRTKYRKYDFFWLAMPASKTARRISYFLRRHYRLSEQDYFKVIKQSKIVFNALSPLNLVSTRYFESMAANSMVLCQKSNVYLNLFKDEVHCVMFNEDMSDFEERLIYYLESENERKKIVERAYQHVLENHTWKIRVKQFTTAIKKLL